MSPNRTPVRGFRWRAIALVLAATVAYVMVHLGLDYLGGGHEAAILSVAPVALAGWLFGWRGGLLAGLLAPLLNVGLLLAGSWWGWHRGLDIGVWMLSSGSLGSAVVLLTGGVTGWLKSMWERSQAEVLAREEAESRLLERARQLEALLGFAHTLGKPTSLRDKATEVVDTVMRAAQADRTVLRQLDPERGGAWRLADSGVGPLRRVSLDWILPGRGITSQALDERRAVIANDYPSHPRAMEELVHVGVKSLAVWPVMVGDRVLGTMVVESTKREHFTPQRVRFLTGVASGLGTLLENARLADEVRATLTENRRRLEAFGQAARTLSLEADSDAALRALVELARGLLGARYGAFLSSEADGGGRVRVAAMEPGLRAGARQAPVAASDGPPQSGVRLQAEWPEGARVPPSLLASALDGPATGVRDTIAAPVLRGTAGGATLFLAGNVEAAGFSADDQRLLDLFALLTNVLWANSRLYRQVTEERSTLEAIQASMTEGLLVVSPDGNVLSVNKAAETISGIAAERVVGRSAMALLRAVAPRVENVEALQTLGHILDGGLRVPASAEVILAGPERKELMVDVFPISGGDSPSAALGFLVRNVTPERDLERRRDAIVSMASHELRTPLTAIVGYSELLLARDVDRQTRQDWLGNIYSEGQRLAGIVDNLLDVSRDRAGTLSMTCSWVQIPRVVAETVQRVLEIEGARPLRVELQPTLPPVWADREKVAQVLTNLLSNAIKYSPRDSAITVSAWHQPQREQAIMAVRDAGMGISPEDQHRLFKTFARISRPETQGIRGVGLGLFVVKTLVELMHGQVWVESVPGEGSTFYFSMPTRRIGSPATDDGAGEKQGADHEERDDRG